MNTYWLLMPTVAVSLIAVAASLLCHKEYTDRHMWQAGYDDLMRENKAQEQQIKTVQAQNADLHDALQEAQDEIQRWQRQTVEMPETVPAKPKRTARKKEVVSE